jgi:hypothetical protein
MSCTEVAEQGLATMRATGFALDRAAYFSDTVTSYVTGFVLQEQAVPSAVPPAAAAGLGQISPEGYEDGTEPAGVTRWQVVHDDSQGRADFADIRAAKPLTAGVGPVPPPCVRITQVGAPVPQGLLCLPWPQAGVLKAGQHRTPAR